MDELKKTILLTGASGFIGTQIARYLLRDEDVTILALIRGNSNEEAARKIAREWWDWPELTNSIGSRTKVIRGDVSLPKLGLDESSYKKAVEEATHIIHTAADWRFVPYQELLKTNVEGTRNLLELARKIGKHQELKRFSHVSTAYVAGAKKGLVPEDTLTDEHGFLSDYEKSKYEAELLIREAKKELPISVFRPSMVVGDSQDGAIKTFNTLYYPLRLFMTGKTRFMPVSPSLKINFVPVDYVAKTIVQLSFDPDAAGLNFHVVAAHHLLPTLGELIEYVRTWSEDKLGTKLAKPVYLNMSTSAFKALLKLQIGFQSKDQRTGNALISLAPYFNEDCRFQRDNIDRLLGPYEMKWREIVPNLLEYATNHGFFHRSDRTVHEQVLFRLASKSHPITYYDLVEDKIVEKSAGEMQEDILAAANALRRMGIEPGDRVALTGLNSTRYLTVDIAIGLVGAVSVPLYYTSPPADIDQILNASQSKLLLVGIPSLMERVGELTTSIPIVSFCRNDPKQNSSKRVISWQEFLSKPNNEAVPTKAPVGFGDTATLRYSSGTTGKPKGSIFRHQNLRYMAESIVSITPWRARNRKATYLSFLPMGHVVEGILATYSPYYYPAPISIYFLENFRGLQRALPKVRPTIFFSVPRIYEKVWEGLEKNKLGQFYLKRKKGLLKRALGRMLRYMTLRRAGLNKCVQLIAGSASSDEDLLKNYRELGIEIHNAYGLTEAPLVTINRVGRNRIGTVGEPMPQTLIRIAEDGEIMVKGPQVTAGYYDKTLEPPFRDGWLLTGDIGEITKEGSLVIFGRKKELIKTSYGKCIYSGKIEGMLRELPGVTEAMLVGESKPYCSALLWVEKNQFNNETAKAIDIAVEEMNQDLSHPEKVKKWAILVNNLSIEKGDLTPNLKLKRNVIAQRFAKTVDALYGGKRPDDEAIYGGSEREGGGT